MLYTTMCTDAGMCCRREEKPAGRVRERQNPLTITRQESKITLCSLLSLSPDYTVMRLTLSFLDPCYTVLEFSHCYHSIPFH